MSQARSRLPIYPEALNVDGRRLATSPALASEAAWWHPVHAQGLFRVTTPQTDFNTDPNKTYHLRWDVTGMPASWTWQGLPTTPRPSSETNPLSDSSYDDMLIARVTTNSSKPPPPSPTWPTSTGSGLSTSLPSGWVTPKPVPQ